MSTNFPTSLDNGTSLPYPASNNLTNAPSLAGGQDNQNDSLIAIQTKLGIFASTPTNGFLLIGTGAGTSAWTKAAPTGIIVGTTDTQNISNKTFTSSTFTSPIITNANITTDLITGFTVPTTGNIYGVPFTLGIIQTANTVSGAALVALSVQTAAIAASAITTAKLNNASVTADKLSLSPTSNYVVTDENSTSATYVGLTTPQAITITVGANGLALIIWSAGLFSGTGAQRMSVAVSGATTTAANDNYSLRFDGTTFTMISSVTHLFTGLTPGSTTFTLQYKTAGGTGHYFERSITAIPL